MSIDAMKAALEALTYIHTETTKDEDELIHAAITTLRLAIEQAEKQEPVAWQGVHDKTDLYWRKPPQADVRPLYTAPPQRQPLTEEERLPIIERFMTDIPLGECFVRAVERKHGIGDKDAP